MGQKQVLILCTGNSCRSQMAEGLINYHLAEMWHACSAGTAPSGYVHPLAIKAMAEVGIDIADNRSKNTNEFRDADLDVAITVCGDAAKNCPVWLGKGKRVHIGFPDPANATGPDDEKMIVFRQVRDDIKVQVLDYLRDF